MTEHPLHTGNHKRYERSFDAVAARVASFTTSATSAQSGSASMRVERSHPRLSRIHQLYGAAVILARDCSAFALPFTRRLLR